MPRGTTQRLVTVGVAEHGNSAVLVTLAPGGALVDRRRVDLTNGLPTHPYHHEGSWAVGRYLDSPWARPMALSDAVALVERVRGAAAQGARESLEALAGSVRCRLRSSRCACARRFLQRSRSESRDARAATIADSVMYREALADAAVARGWSVHWYDAKHVFQDAVAAVGREDIEGYLQAMGASVGPPWQAKHKLAAAAALAAASRP